MPFVELLKTSLLYPAKTGEVLAVDSVDMTVEEGEFAAIVGPSGCGKSTLLKLVAGLRKPTTGTIIVDGNDISEPLKIAGMAFQNATLLPWRNVRDNVLLPLEIVKPHRSKIKKDRKSYEQRADEILGSVGLEGFGDRLPNELSGGMQQRVSLCRALIHEPKLLLLDEPFAALDAFTREELWCVLRDLWQKQKFTCILVTHDLREATFLADMIHVMTPCPGKILQSHKISFPHPRAPEILYKPDFVNIVQNLRNQIATIIQK